MLDNSYTTKLRDYLFRVFKEALGNYLYHFVDMIKMTFIHFKALRMQVFSLPCDNVLMGLICQNQCHSFGKLSLEKKWREISRTFCYSIQRHEKVSYRLHGQKH